MPWVQLRFAEYHFNMWKIKRLARPVGKMISAVDASLPLRLLKPSAFTGLR